MTDTQVQLTHKTYGTVWASRDALMSEGLMVPVKLKTPTRLPYVGSTAHLVVGKSALKGHNFQTPTRGKTLAEKYLPLAYSIATQMRLKDEDWEEVASLACEVLSRAASDHAAGGKYKDGLFSDYARARIVGAILNYRRKQTRDKEKTKMVSVGYVLFMQQVKSAEEKLISLEREADLLGAVNELPSDQSDLIHMYFYAGMSQQEIADHIGVSKMTISNKIKGICSVLRATLLKK